MPKIKIPDGSGGFLTVDATRMDGQAIKDPIKQQAEFEQAQEKAFWERVGTAAERFNELEKAVGTEMGLTEEEMVAAKYLDLLNWQQFFPKKLGGPRQFAAICTTVQHWFTRQLEG